MKHLKFNIVLILVIIIGITGCKKKFDDYSQNKNQPFNVPPSLLLRSIEGDMIVNPAGQEERNCQFTACNYTYYGNNKYWDGTDISQYASLNYRTLNDVVAMESQAAKVAGTNDNPYSALGKFFRAFYFVSMSLKVGDLPMTEALKGIENKTPKYDTQKQIFVQSVKWLDTANTQLGNFIKNGFLEFSGDFYYNERISNPLLARDALVKWQKVVNTFRLRVLIELSKKAADPDLTVAQQFTAIVNNPTQYPIMTAMDDNLQYVWNDKFNYYPINNTSYGREALRYNMASTYLNILAGTKDLRAMMVAEPARGLGFADDSYSSFVGAPVGEDLSTMSGKVQAGKYSLIGRHRYYVGLTGEPTFIVSYPEMCFNIAEGINRGWVTGDAESWYKKGIQASQGFYGIVDGANTVFFQKINGGLGEEVTYTVNFNFATYYAQPEVKYAGNSATGLNQILTQKYLAFARNSGYEAYYQWRRTGVPTFDVGPGIGNSSIIPKRFQYPVTESGINGTNYTEAVQRQFSGNDNINQDLWIVK